MTRPQGAIEVLSRFLANPATADTIEGIARWRLREDVVGSTVDEVAEAVAWLVAEEFLAERRAGSTHVYSLNGGRIAAARQLVAAAGRV